MSYSQAMKRLDWIPVLALNSEPVDQQHQHLFEIYNSAVEFEDDLLDQEGMLGQLFEYAQFHFSDEEAFMESVGYPPQALEAHKRLHRGFIQRLGTLQDAPAWELLDYIREWLLRHIMAEDSKIGRFVTEQNKTGVE